MIFNLLKIQDALKDLLSGTIQDMLETEMDDHLGYDRYERSGEPNYRNGTKSKTVRSKYGEFQVDVPQDRQSSFEPQVLPKRQKDISSIDDKIISMYAKGMTTRQISETIEDIYGFEVSEGMVSDIEYSGSHWFFRNYPFLSFQLLYIYSIIMV